MANISYFTIKSQENLELLLEVQGGSPKPGTKVVPGYQDKVKSEVWFRDTTDDCIRSKDTGYYMDIHYGCVVVSPEPHQKCKTVGDHIESADGSRVLWLFEDKCSSVVRLNVANEKTADTKQKWKFDNVRSEQR